MILVNPCIHSWYSCPSLGLAYLCAVTRKSGARVQIVDCGIHRSPASVLRRALEEEKGRAIVGITANVATIAQALRIAAFVRKVSPSAAVIMGGPHPSIIYEHLVPKHCDAVIVGEAELVFADIAAGRLFREIAGAVFWEDGLKVNPPPGHIQDLDALPFPDWNGFDLPRFRFPGRQPVLPLITSRGCPYRCINCTKVIHGYAYRTRSVENVTEEIAHGVRNWGIREVQIWDDNFTLKPDRVKEICRSILRRRLHRKVRFLLPGGIRADICDEEMFDLFARIGVYYVGVAVESGKQEVVNRIGKKLDLAVVDRMVRALVGRGIRVALYFMMGFPFETREDMEETIRFAATLPAHHVHFFLVTPFPGTPLYDLVGQYGRFVTEPSLGFPSYDESLSCFVVPQYSREDLAERLKKAYRTFYRRPSQVLRTLAPFLHDLQDIPFLARSAWHILTKGRRV